MAIHRSSLVGVASIGVYILATDQIVIIPKWVPLQKAQKYSMWLKAKLAHTNVGGSVLAGTLASANSNGILLPHFTGHEEIGLIETVFNGNITIMQTKKTAYGNMVLTNDKGAIVDPRLKDSEIKEISETLDVEAVRGEIAGLSYVGSLAVATNKGVLAHPMLKDHEMKILEDVLKVPVDLGTTNCGIPYIGTGVVCNSHAAVVGALTTGPEMFIIGNVFDVVKDYE